jgi:hypothetical protein
MTDIAKRFARDAADHAMTVLHDDGLYRHLRFQRQVWRPPLLRPLKSSTYWFDLITAPGTLIFEGDGESFVFRRLEDMFEFFRGRVGEINPGYWQEKVVSGRDGIRTYDEQIFRERVLEAFTDAAAYGGVPIGTGRALREQVFDDDYGETHYEDGARAALNRFEHDGFRFEDTWEWDFRDYDWWFLWACHAIVWGIAYYDKGARPTMPNPAATGPRRRKVRPERRVISGPAPQSGPGRRAGYRPIVDVELPAEVTS